jgi:NTE family protein
MASSSIPVLFESMKIKNDIYMDGGIVDNLPVEPIQNKCKKIIAVHVNPVGEEKNLKGIIKMAFRSFHLSVAAGVKFKKDDIDIFIEPLELKDFGLLDLNRGRSMFNIGYEEAKKILTQKKEGIRA